MARQNPIQDRAMAVCVIAFFVGAASGSTPAKTQPVCQLPGPMLESSREHRIDGMIKCKFSRQNCPI